MKKTAIACLTLAAGLALAISCKKSGSDDGGSKSGDSFDRKGLLTNMSANIILPAYTAFQADASTFNDAIVAFNASSAQAKLPAAQTAFMALYKQRQSTSEYDFGPGLALNAP